jgi:hypothetical protein
MTNIHITGNDVEDFKEIFCNENALIQEILQNNFLEVLTGRILDVGGGTADILSDVVPTEEVIHLDILDFSSTPIPEAHTRIQGDFLDTNLIDTLKPLSLLFMSHVLQFIDNDLEKLNRCIQNTDAKNIILIEDLNNDFLGEVMNFSVSHFKDANPEIHIDNFPYGYRKVTSIPFTALLTCKDFHSLTKQCLYLMDLPHSEENIHKMKTFLEEKLSEPSFTINQEVNLYQK